MVTKQSQVYYQRLAQLEGIVVSDIANVEEAYRLSGRKVPTDVYRIFRQPVPQPE
jgi:hypothetical protein